MAEDFLRRTRRLAAVYERDAALAPCLELQNEIAARMRLEALSQIPRLVAGCDVSYKEGYAHAAIVLFDEDGRILEETDHSSRVIFPYISGLLTFREFEPLYQAFLKLSNRPELLLIDGQGIAHPRRCGLATHVGVLLDIPAIGCAKSRLVGDWRMPADYKGAREPLFLQGEQAGWTIRSRQGVKPLFASPGHRVSLEDVYREIMRRVGKYKLPEPTRRADALSRIVRKKWEAGQ